VPRLLELVEDRDRQILEGDEALASRFLSIDLQGVAAVERLDLVRVGRFW
jgi:hypothetical protein